MNQASRTAPACQWGMRAAICALLGIVVSGPLAVDYGFNVTKQPYEDIGAINFAIGLF